MCLLYCACRAKCIFPDPLQMSHTCQRFCALLASKCASRHNGVHFFDMSTSKSAPRPSVFNTLPWKCASRHNGVHFFDMSTSKNWSEHGVFSPFWCAFSILTWKCASRHNGVHFFDMSTSKSAPRPSAFNTLTLKWASRHNGVTCQLPKLVRTWCVFSILVCFLHFDLEMCFAPQQRALFRHRNFQKWSDAGVFCTF